MNIATINWSPTFRQWLHDVQILLGSEIEDAGQAYSVYDDGATPAEGAEWFRQNT